MAEDTLPWETQQGSGDSLPWETQDATGKQPMSGSFWDSFWNQSVEGKMLNGFGLGASQGWGAAMHYLAPDEEQIFKNIPSIAKVFKDSNDSTSKAFHEAFTRPNLFQSMLENFAPIGGAAAALIGGIGGAGQGLAESLEGTAQQLNKLIPGAGALPGEAGELIGSYATGENFGEVSGLPEAHGPSKELPIKPTEIPEPTQFSETLPKVPTEQQGVLPDHLSEEPINTPRPIADDELRDTLGENLEDEFQISGQKIHQTPIEDYWGMLNTSRAHGMIGEGEGGFFNTFPLDEKTVEARTQAAIEAGLPEVPEIKPPVTDPYVVATGINPELMAKHYSINDQMNELRQKKEDLLVKTAPFPDPDFVTSEIERLEAKKKLSTKEQNRIEDLYEFKKAYKELVRAHQDLLDLDNQLRDISPDVAATVNYARTLIPDLQAEAHAAWYKEASNFSQETARLDAEQRARPVEYSEPIGALGHDDEVSDFFKKILKPSEGEPQEPLSGFSTVPGRGNIKEKPLGAPTKLTQPVREEPPTTTAKGTEEAPQGTGRVSGGSLKQVQGTGERRIMGGALAIEARAIEAGLNRDLGPLQTYDRRVFADQAPDIAELITKDPERAEAVAMGERAAPKDMIPELVANALESKAREEGDWELVRRLANSKLVSDANIMATRLRARGENVGGPSAAIRAVQEAKQVAAKRSGEFDKAIKRELERAKQEMNNAVPDKKTWEDYLEELRCK